MVDCQNKQKNLKQCNCTYNCDKKGLCCECIVYHRERNELPACFFSKEAEASYDRSVKNFCEGVVKNES